jgi:hypothetical protein
MSGHVDRERNNSLAPHPSDMPDMIDRLSIPTAPRFISCSISTHWV